MDNISKLNSLRLSKENIKGLNYSGKCDVLNSNAVLLARHFQHRFDIFFKKICGALRDLVPVLQFKKREKHPWRSVNLIKLQASACNFTKSNTPPWVFFTFLNCAHSTKSRNAPHNES